MGSGAAGKMQGREEQWPDEINKDLIKRLTQHGEILCLPEGYELLVHRTARAPASGANRNPGRHDRLLGDKPVRT